MLIPKKVIGFGNEGRLTLLEESPRGGHRRRSRIRLDGDYGVQFMPLRTEDEGDYFCIVNGRDRPSRVTRILVEGKENYHSPKSLRSGAALLSRKVGAVIKRVISRSALTRTTSCLGST